MLGECAVDEQRVNKHLRWFYSMQVIFPVPGTCAFTINECGADKNIISTIKQNIAFSIATDDNTGT